MNNIIHSVSDGTVLVEVVLPAGADGGYRWRVLVEGVLVGAGEDDYGLSLDALFAALSWWRGLPG